MGVDHGDAAAQSLPVQRKYRYRRTFVARIIFIMHHFVPECNERFGIDVYTQMVCMFPYKLDKYDVFHI